MLWIKCQSGDYLNPDNLISISKKELREGGWRVVGMLAHAEKNYPIADAPTKEQAQELIEVLVGLHFGKEEKDGVTPRSKENH